MEHRTIRKVRIEEPSDAWLRVRVGAERLDADTPLGMFSVLFSTLIRWGGVASIVGGALWIITFLLLQIYLFERYSSTGIALLIQRIMFSLDAKFPAVAMLLLLFGLVGIYTKQREFPSRTGKVGFLLSSLGLVLAIIFTLTRGSGLLLGGADPSIIIFDGWQSSPSAWYSLGQPGQMILSIGLVLFGIAMLKAKVLPTNGIMLLMAGALMPMIAIFLLLLSLAFNLDIDVFYTRELYNQFDIFTVPALLFGVSWVWLGRALWLESSKP